METSYISYIFTINLKRNSIRTINIYIMKNNIFTYGHFWINRVNFRVIIVKFLQPQLSMALPFHRNSIHPVKYIPCLVRNVLLFEFSLSRINNNKWHMFIFLKHQERNENDRRREKPEKNKRVHFKWAFWRFISRLLLCFSIFFNRLCGLHDPCLFKIQFQFWYRF